MGAPASLTVVDTLPEIEYFRTTFDMNETLCLVVPDRAVLDEFWALQSAALDNYAADPTAVRWWTWTAPTTRSWT